MDHLHHRIFYAVASPDLQINKVGNVLPLCHRVLVKLHGTSNCYPLQLTKVYELSAEFDQTTIGFKWKHGTSSGLLFKITVHWQVNCVFIK